MSDVRTKWSGYVEVLDRIMQQNKKSCLSNRESLFVSMMLEKIFSKFIFDKKLMPCLSQADILMPYTAAAALGTIRENKKYIIPENYMNGKEQYIDMFKRINDLMIGALKGFKGV